MKSRLAGRCNGKWHTEARAVACRSKSPVVLGVITSTASDAPPAALMKKRGER